MDNLLLKLGFSSSRELLLYFPFRYEDHTTLVSPSNFLHGGYSFFLVHIKELKWDSSYRKRFTVHADCCGSLVLLRYIHPASGMSRLFQSGVSFYVYGQTRRVHMAWEVIHPQLTSTNKKIQLPQYFKAIYMANKGVDQSLIRAIHCLLQRPIKDYLPTSIRNKYKLWGLEQSIRYLHYVPIQDKPYLEAISLKEHSACRRLIFDELLAYQLVKWRAYQDRQARQAYPFVLVEKEEALFIKSLPFSLTYEQEKVWNEIRSDLLQAKPMHRLLQGDVGSGKTILGVLATLHAVLSGVQVAVMVPTELLAEQHYSYFKKHLGSFNFSISLLTSKVKSLERRKITNMLVTGTLQVLIGTHALIQESLEFKKLSLVIIDEQHRFGVAQRLLLNQKSSMPPHQLMMSATPIPRTLFTMFYEHIDVSTLKMKPQDRPNIDTCIMSDKKREDLQDKVLAFCLAQKGQVYWVCPLIEESEKLGLRTVLQVFQELQNKFSGIRLALLHGKIPSSEKIKVLLDFQRGEIDLLVTTTVIEVGIDIPNATLIVIEDAQRFGLAQLHQLRGRVGRSNRQSYCILLYREPLSNTSKKRLFIMRDCHDGFQIAQEDLECRGGGDLFGLEQSGENQFIYASTQVPEDWLSQINQIKEEILCNYSDRIEEIIEFWRSERRGIDLV